jgi:hypothetical protein
MTDVAIEHAIRDEGTLHVLADGTARLDFTDDHGLMVGVSTDAVVTLDNPDSTVPGPDVPGWEGPVDEAPDRLEPGVYAVWFEIHGERAWEHRRLGRVYGTVTRALGGWTTVHLTRSYQGKVGDLLTFRPTLVQEITTALADGGMR